MKGILNLLSFAIVNGVTAEITINAAQASDGRHPPFITTFTLPSSHIAWPEGTVMVKGANAGEAVADTEGEGENIVGVLQTKVEANEQSGNVMIHGSCPAEILKWVDGGELADANAEQIEALRGIGIYV